MRILRQQLGAFKQDVQVETSVCKLGFIITSVTGFTAAVFNAMTVEVNVTTSNNGSRVIVPKMSLRDAFNMSSMGEGFFVWGENTLKGCILISEQGSLVLQNGDNLSVSYEGFPA